MMTILHYFLPLFASSLWMRLSHLFTSQGSEHFHASLLRGVTSDMAVTFLLAWCCVGLSRIRIAPFVLCALYCFMLAANREFLIANDANLDFFMLNQALDGTFIEGAVLTLPMAWKFLQAAGVFALTYALLRKLPLHFNPRLSSIMGVCACLFVVASPISSAAPSWMQMNALEDNLSNARYVWFSNVDVGGNTHLPPHYLDYFFSKEVREPPRVEFPKKPVNVLMIALESIGHQHIEEGDMPFLETLTKQSLYYPNYVVAAQVTVNGLYAMLCADNPGFMRPKVGDVKVWSMKNPSQERFCLPKLLKENGYQTVYMQSADLKFQRKASVMPMMGFQEVMGKQQLDPHDTSDWGPDDKGLYTHILDKIEKLQEKPEPWFITALTITTHHPKVVPADFYLMRKGKKVLQPYLYADFALEYLIDELKKRGILENTLVVITNDEVRGSGPGVAGNIRKNNGVLMVLTPTQDTAEIKTIHLQTDIFLSLADYLGLNTDDISIGRSIFRKYNSFRPIFFTNFFSKKLFVYPKPGQMLICKWQTECKTYKESSGKLFHGKWKKAPLFHQWEWLIKSISKRNDQKSARLWAEIQAAADAAPP